MNKDLLDIQVINEYISKRKIDWTKHCLNRLNQRNILISDVKLAISNGKIIEYYYDDFPYPSCLILGYNVDNKILHIVCGISDNLVHMITAIIQMIKSGKKIKEQGGNKNELFYV